MLAILVLCALVATSQAIVCAPFLCDNAVKLDVSTCKGGVIKNGGFCGCTDACAKVEGEDCQAGPAFYRGVPPIGKCDQGLVCRANIDGITAFGRGTCTKSIVKRATRTLCEQRRMTAMISMAIWAGKWTPRCDHDGNFFPHQCDFSGSCFCVEKETGKILTPRTKAGVKC